MQEDDDRDYHFNKRPDKIYVGKSFKDSECLSGDFMMSYKAV